MTCVVMVGANPRVPEIVSEVGIIGFRGDFSFTGEGAAKPRFRNHMAAKRLRDSIDLKFFNSAYKFCNIRNPFDKLVSAYWNEMDGRTARTRAAGGADALRADFKAWLGRQTKIRRDADKYFIGQRMIADGFIRYEQLHADIEETAHRIGAPYEPDRLPRTSGGKRARSDFGFWEHYDAATEAIVAEAFAFEIERFGYRCAPH